MTNLLEVAQVLGSVWHKGFVLLLIGQLEVEDIMASMPRKTSTETATLVIRPPHMTAAEFQYYVFGVQHVYLDCKMQSIHEAAFQVGTAASSRDIKKVQVMIFNHGDDTLSNVMQRL